MVAYEEMEPKVAIAEFKRKLKLRAFGGIVLSTVAITACLILFPILLIYVQRLHSSVQAEVRFCRQRTRDFWKEMLDVEQTSGVSADRLANAATMLRRTDPNVAVDFARLRFVRQPVEECCTCHRGAAGPEGPAGRDGRAGEPGRDGNPGAPGPDARAPSVVGSLFPSQCPCEADAGTAGPKGPPGPSGNNGQDGPPGQDGRPGQSGKPGPKGPPGQPGRAGQKGPRGDPGATTTVSGRPGSPGPAGRPGGRGQPGRPGGNGSDGRPGEKGQPGNAGTNGNNGGPGKQGPPGQPGSNGPKGPCDHCPNARLAPGY